MKKKEHHEEHVDETWLIPYADMLTLLLALFIVMFAMGKTDKEKMKAVGREFNVIFAGGSGLLEEDGTKPIKLDQAIITSESKSAVEEVKMSEAKKMLEQEIKNKGYEKQVKVELNEDGLEISIQDAVLFNSGEAEVLKKFSPVLEEIAKMLKKFDNNIKIAGHTDNVPIHTSKFNSNWDLSSMRAINVMNFIIKSGQLSPKQFSVQAYGEYQPKYDNATAEGRAKNRRVEVFIERQYKDE